MSGYLCIFLLLLNIKFIFEGVQALEKTVKCCSYLWLSNKFDAHKKPLRRVVMRL